MVVPFFTHASAVERLRGVVAALDESRYDLVLFNVESPVHRDEHLGSLTGRDRADGLLVMSLPAPARDLDRLTAAGVPVVLVDARGSRRAGGGHRRRGGRPAWPPSTSSTSGTDRSRFIGDDPENAFGFTSSAQREQGYAAVLEEAGIPYRPSSSATAPHDRTSPRASPPSCWR